MNNLITDVAGLRVGHADDARLKSGVTVVLCDEPAVASAHVMGGAPGTRDTDLLAPEQTVGTIDAVVLVRRLRLRPRSGQRRHVRSCRSRPRRRHRRGPRADRSGRHPLRSPERRRQELGRRLALPGARPRRSGRCGAGLRAWQRRRRHRRHHGQSQGRPRLGLDAPRQRHYRRCAGRGQCASARRPSATARISGRPPSSAMASSAASACPPPFPAECDRAPLQGPGHSAPSTTIAVVATDARLSKAEAKRLCRHDP